MTPFRGGGREAELVVRPVRRARGLRLSVDALRGRVLLTVPPRASRRAALAWAETRRAWVEQLLAEAPPGRPFVPGVELPWDGQELAIDWSEARARTPRRDGDRLLCGGPAEHLPARVTAWLKHDALRLLGAHTHEVAARAGVPVGRVRVGDPRTRWGSCSGSGTVSYSWRLPFAPPYVWRAVVAHEVAHRLHMDHSPAFYAAYADLLGEDPAPADRWLKGNGRELFLFGRS